VSTVSLAQGKVSDFLFFVIAAAFTIYYLWTAIQGKPQPLRILPQYEAISDGIDKAVEEGKPVYVTPGGYAYLSGMYASMTIAGMEVTRHVAKLAIRKGATPHFPVSVQPEHQPLVDGIYREACVEEGKPEAYRRENVQYFGNTEGNYSTGITGWIARDGCSCYIVVGAFGGGIDTMPVEWASEWGGVTIGGTARWSHQGTITMLTDYPLHLDDIFALGAICTQDPVVMSSLTAGDIVKFLMMAIVLIGSILAVAGQPVVHWLKT
jgi:hypothetical protein